MVKEQLNRYKSLTDESLSACLKERNFDYREVLDAMAYSLSAGGKRIRAALTLAFGALCGESEESLLPLACAVEMVHTYSLIHDDLPCMDDDDMRRGQPSCHIKFGEATALLAGDALLTMAFEQIAECDLSAEKRVEAVKILSRAAGAHGMIGGQCLDLSHEGKPIGLDKLDRINSLKTSAMMDAACLLGCLSAKTEKCRQAASVYAQNVGLAFQIVDDILDVIGNEKSLGKPIGSDEQNRKDTYVSHLGVDCCRRKAKELTQTACEALTVFDGDFSFLKELAIDLLSRVN